MRNCAGEGAAASVSGIFGIGGRPVLEFAGGQATAFDPQGHRFATQSYIARGQTITVVAPDKSTLNLTVVSPDILRMTDGGRTIDLTRIPK